MWISLHKFREQWGRMEIYEKYYDLYLIWDALVHMRKKNEETHPLRFLPGVLSGWF